MAIPISKYIIVFPYCKVHMENLIYILSVSIIINYVVDLMPLVLFCMHSIVNDSKKVPLILYRSRRGKKYN